jgi:ZIP family zinc transporter
VALGIAIHNTPEGIAVGAGYAHTPAFGIYIAIAITLHNIPEGIATALPLYKAGMPKGRAARFAFLSGLTEPIGALLASLVLFSNTSLVPAALAFAAGVMVFITLDELIPVAREHGHQHYTAVGIILGALFVFMLSGLFEI